MLNFPAVQQTTKVAQTAPKRCALDNDDIVAMTPHNVASLPSACSEEIFPKTIVTFLQICRKPNIAL